MKAKRLVDTYQNDKRDIQDPKELEILEDTIAFENISNLPRE